MKELYYMSEREQSIIRRAVRVADTFGLGRVSASRHALEEEGVAWTRAHEQYLCDLDENTVWGEPV